MENITLYFKEGAADKVYQAAIEPQDGGYVVNFAYGRRGNTLTSGSKTTAPVCLRPPKPQRHRHSVSAVPGPLLAADGSRHLPCVARYPARGYGLSRGRMTAITQTGVPWSRISEPSRQQSISREERQKK